MPVVNEKEAERIPASKAECGPSPLESDANQARKSEYHARRKPEGDDHLGMHRSQDIPELVRIDCFRACTGVAHNPGSTTKTGRRCSISDGEIEKRWRIGSGPERPGMRLFRPRTGTVSSPV